MRYTPHNDMDIKIKEEEDRWCSGLATMGRNLNSYRLRVGMEDGRNILKVWQFFKNIKLPYDPAILFLCIHPRVIKTYVYTKTCITMFTVELDISKN